MVQDPDWLLVRQVKKEELTAFELKNKLTMRRIIERLEKFGDILRTNSHQGNRGGGTTLAEGGAGGVHGGGGEGRGSGAIDTVVTVAEILKNNGLATEKKILTSTVGTKDESKGRFVHKAKIEILLGKIDNFDDLVSHGKGDHGRKVETEEGTQEK